MLMLSWTTWWVVIEKTESNTSQRCKMTKMKNNRHQLHQAKLWLYTKKQNFMKTVMWWNELPRAAAEHPSSESELIREGCKQLTLLWARDPGRWCPSLFCSFVTLLHKYKSEEFYQGGKGWEVSDYFWFFFF